MNATTLLLVALPVVGTVIGLAGLWLSKRLMPSRKTASTPVLGDFARIHNPLHPSYKFAGGMTVSDLVFTRPTTQRMRASHGE